MSKNIFKNILLLVAGIIWGIMLILVIPFLLTFVLKTSNLLLVEVGYSVLALVSLVFAWRKNKFLGAGLTISLVVFLCFMFLVIKKGSDESRLFNVTKYEGRVLITSSPPGGTYFHPASGKYLVDVAGYPPQKVFYRRDGKIVATLKGVSDLELTVELKPGMRELHFDFKREYLRKHGREISFGVVRAIKNGEVLEQMTKEQKIVSQGYPEKTRIKFRNKPGFKVEDSGDGAYIFKRK